MLYIFSFVYQTDQSWDKLKSYWLFFFTFHTDRDEKLSVYLRKSWEILFEPNLRTMTQEEHLRKLWELFHPLEVKAQLCKFFQDRGAVHQMTYYW